MSPKFIDESLPATAPSAHSGFSKGKLGIYVVLIMTGTSAVIRTTVSPLKNTSRGDGAMGNLCAVDNRVAGSCPTGQLLICFSVFAKILCQHSSLAPRPRIRAFMRRLRCCFPQLRPPDQWKFIFEEKSIVAQPNSNLLPFGYWRTIIPLGHHHLL